jgi:hypothetical protein
VQTTGALSHQLASLLLLGCEIVSIYLVYNVISGQLTSVKDKELVQAGSDRHHG